MHQVQLGIKAEIVANKVTQIILSLKQVLATFAHPKCVRIPGLVGSPNEDGTGWGCMIQKAAHQRC